MRALTQPLTPARRGRGGNRRALVLPLYPPGRLWVAGRELDAAGTRLHVQLLNDAMAPTLPAGTWCTAWEVQAAGPLTPGLYLVRWPAEARAYVSYVGRLTAEGLEPDRLSFDFDGPLPEPVVSSVPRVGTDAPGTRLYRIESQ